MTAPGVTSRRGGSLKAMFDHVAIAVSDLGASERFYRTLLSALGFEPSHADAGLVEWEDLAIGPTDREHPVARGLHVGLRAPHRAAVDAFWQAGIDAGHPHAGGFLLDPDGNSVEAVHRDGERAVPDARSTTCGSASATRRRRGASTRRSRRTPGSTSRTTRRIACSSPAPTSPSRSCTTSAR